MAWGIKIERAFFAVASILCLAFCSAYTTYEPDFNQYRANAQLQNDFSGYMSTLKAKIQRTWIPPDFLESGHVTVMFKVSRYGDILSAQIVESSNNAVYDESVLEAIKKSAPFDKFPAHTARDFLTIKYSFDSSLVKTDQMKSFVDKAEEYYNINNETALDYINRAIAEVQGDINSYFLYGKRSKIKRALGDIDGANEDLQECKRLKAKVDQKRIVACKVIAEMENSPFAYYHLAYSYEIAGDYERALEAIDKAIELTQLNNGYKRYRQELVAKKATN